MISKSDGTMTILQDSTRNNQTKQKRRSRASMLSAAVGVSTIGWMVLSGGIGILLDRRMTSLNPPFQFLRPQEWSIELSNPTAPINKEDTVSDPPLPTNSTSPLAINPSDIKPPLPKWMTEYFAWHRQACWNMTHSSATESWKDYDYLVVRCLTQDKVCGGAADRLKPLPYYLLVAAQTKRLLFFYWERPARLESFLLPPTTPSSTTKSSSLVGFNWTWPPHPDMEHYKFSQNANIRSMTQLNKWMLNHQHHIDDNNENENNSKDHEVSETIPSKRHTTKDTPPENEGPEVMSVLIQSHFHGAHEYNAHVLPQSGDESNVTRNHSPLETFSAPSYQQVFDPCWKAVFVPSPPVQEQIDRSMKELHLIPNHYHAIHIRSRYHRRLTEPQRVAMATNAVHCLGHLVVAHHPLSSSTSLVNDYNNTTAVARNNASTPMSLAFHNQTRIFVAADHGMAAQAAVHYAQNMGLVHATMRRHPASSSTGNQSSAAGDDHTLHLDLGHAYLSPPNKKKKNRKQSETRDDGKDIQADPPSEALSPHEASEHYDTFVDLYILSHAKCIVHNLGVSVM